MRNLVKGTRAVCGTNPYPQPWLFVQSLDLRGHVEEALRAQEEACARTRWVPDEPQMSRQFGQVALGAKVEVGRSALRVETRGNRQTLDQRGFSVPVLADEDRHSGIKGEGLDVANCG